MYSVGEPTNDTFPLANLHCPQIIIGAYELPLSISLKVNFPVLLGGGTQFSGNVCRRSLVSESPGVWPAKEANYTASS